MPSVVLTERAENDLNVIHEYYRAALGTEAAFEAVLVILESFNQLERFPGSGRLSVMPDIRELVIGRYPFVAPYRLEHGQVQVLRVLHQRSERPVEW